MTSFANVHQIKRDTVEIVQSPRRVKVSEAAVENLKFQKGDGSVTDFTLDIAPYMREPMDCLGSREFDGVIFVAPAQTGKTLGLLSGLHTYAVTCAPGDMMIVHMSQDTARDYSLRMVDRIHRISPAIRKRLRSKGSADNVFDKHYRSGMILNIAWPSPSQLASKSLKYVALTDYDRMPEDVGGEGSAWAQAHKRTTAFMSSGITLAESSPGYEILEANWKREDKHEAPPCKGILSLYNMGDRRRFYWTCYHCGELFEPTFDVLKWVDSADVEEASHSVKCACPHCGGLHTHDQKYDLNQSGEWVKIRDSRYATFWMQGAAAAFQTWPSLVRKYLLAKKAFELTGSEEELKNTLNLDQGVPYLPESRKSDNNANQFMERLTHWVKRTVPEDVRFLTASIDVQGGKNKRFVVQVHGHGVDRQKWLVDRFNIRDSNRYRGNGDPYPIDPGGHPEDWEVITNDVVLKAYPLSDDSGRAMPIKMTTVDSGGEDGVTQNAYDWYKTLVKAGHSKRVRLLKGGSNKNAPLHNLTYPENGKNKAQAHGQIPLILINTDKVKDIVNNDLSRGDEGIGYFHFPQWLGEWFFNELVSENRTDKGWERIGKQPNEAFDLCVYNHIAWLLLKADKINWLRPPVWADTWDKNTFLITDQGEPVQAKAYAPARRVRYSFR